jgi:hypothetical protein
LERPREEENLEWRALGFGCLDAGYDGFHVVGYDAEDAVVAGCGGVEHLDGAVGGEGHCCDLLELQQYRFMFSIGVTGPEIRLDDKAIRGMWQREYSVGMIIS